MTDARWLVVSATCLPDPGNGTTAPARDTCPPVEALTGLRSCVPPRAYRPGAGETPRFDCEDSSTRRWGQPTFWRDERIDHGSIRAGVGGPRYLGLRGTYVFGCAVTPGAAGAVTGVAPFRRFSKVRPGASAGAVGSLPARYPA